MKKTPVLAVVGPTAAGKSALAMKVAGALCGEIVCMDSMQIYRGMDIGTAKPTKAEQAEIPHHMLDIVEPTEAFSVADYAEKAEPILHEIWTRGKLPVLVGGTGLYLRALLKGLSLGGAKSDAAVRDRLCAIAGEEGGRERLHAMLKKIDPPTAAKLHANDQRRVIRALEVFEVTGKPISAQDESMPERPFAVCMLGATMAREKLYVRVERRVDEMISSGLLQEVQGLLRAGVPLCSQAMQGIGYKELASAKAGNAGLAEAVDTLKRNTRRYAKRQWTWFRAEEGVQWIDTLEETAAEEATRLARVFWQQQA